jgi:hypothetical protein
MPQIIEDTGDRLVVRLDPGGPIELSGLTDSLGSLARMYGRHYRTDKDIEPAPRLYVTKLQTGSVIAEITPYAMIMGALVTTMGGANSIGDFANRVGSGLRAFSNPSAVGIGPTVVKPTRQDASDIRAFVRPLTGKNGAGLNVKHARMSSTESVGGDRHVVVEYSFDENEINRAALNIDEALEGIGPASELIEDIPSEPMRESIVRGVMLFFEQASRAPGKEKGRTGDRGIVHDISGKALPVYFRKSYQNLKDRMVRGETNPLTNNAFLVDLYVHRDETDEPKAYYVTHVHDVVQIGS